MNVSILFFYLYWTLTGCNLNNVMYIIYKSCIYNQQPTKKLLRIIPNKG